MIHFMCLSFFVYLTVGAIELNLRYVRGIMTA